MRYVFAADDNYAMPLAVALRSLADASTEQASVTVLSDGIAAEHQAMIRQSCSVDFMDVSRVLPEDLPLPGYVSRSTYARLWAPEMLDDQRLIYLDCDILVTDDLTPLGEWDLGGKTIGATRDVDSPVVSCPGGIANWRSMGVSPNLPLYNAGMLIIDRDAWLDRNCASRVLDFVRAHPDVNWADQDGINMTLAEEIAPMPLRWNAQPPIRRPTHLGYAFFDCAEVDEAISNPAVVHFAEGTKPWHHRAPDPLTADWRAAVQRTAWAGWTPPRGPSVVQRAARRAKLTFRRA